MSNQLKTSRIRPVKNKSAAPIQITVEQILRDAFEQRETLVKPPEWEIRDSEELYEYRLRKRKDFEDWISFGRQNIATYMRYAKWEEQQNDLVRARSVYERALEMTVREPVVWVAYAEMEMRHKNVNLARNVWDRAVTLMPNVSQFWYKYIHMEEMLKNYAGVRQLYERWMQWVPEEKAWYAYLRWEIRNREHERVRDIFHRLVRVHPSTRSFIKWAKYEESVNDLERARAVYTTAFEVLSGDVEQGVELSAQECEFQEKLFVSFAQFEERCRQYDRARAIYKYGLDNLPKSSAREVYKSFVTFEKKFGNRDTIEDVIFNKRRFRFEEEVKANPHGYDIWFDYLKLEESTKNPARVREIYERAIANVPPVPIKQYWRRYIFLWINYAIYEELEAKDIERARQVYKTCLNLIPHRQFSFSKIWIMFAHFELRQNDLEATRKIMGQAIGKAPKKRVFEAYIQFEQALVNFDRCRTIYTKWIEHSPESCRAWIAFCEFEISLGEHERAIALFELAIDQPILDLPELLWKAYIDFEISQKRYKQTTSLYERLLQRTQHVKVWHSFAQFKRSIGSIGDAREIYKRGFNCLKSDEAKDQRITLIEAWRDFEQEFGDENTLREVVNEMPRRVKKRRQILTEDGQEAGWEEYYDYIFPDREETKHKLKLLEAARKWKEEQSKSGEKK
ncbi:crooked neck-like protein 1 [Schistocerca gregaria]|uniref:crooked neck-like protein 1 n=1 Tax=Schistocerca gregaria TaxID=7010 RepID=UPI00211DE234|nr:crooked neck-like protein 1 [Schistocerca gregaria]XP_049849441.1 crooked neck-like protein 1 [Schistocerca gregaria]